MSTTETSASSAASVPYDACILTTERLTLRPMTMDEATDSHGSFKSAKSIVRYLRWEVHDHDEIPNGRVRKRLASGRLEKMGDGLIFAVELSDADGGHGREIGDVSIFMKSERNAQFEVGWVFHPAVHGHGYATEAATALLDLAFDQLGAHRVFAELDTRNETSARLCGVLGMRQEAELKGRELVDGEWHDMAIYAILAEEWAARERPALPAAT